MEFSICWASTVARLPVSWDASAIASARSHQIVRAIASAAVQVRPTATAMRKRNLGWLASVDICLYQFVRKFFRRLYGKIGSFVQSDGELLASLNATLTSDRQRRLPHIGRFRNSLAIAIAAMYAFLPTTISESGVPLGDDAYFRAEFRWRGEMGRRMSVKDPTATWRYVPRHVRFDPNIRHSFAERV